jgi:DNA polymerase III alpha subunit
MNKRTVEALIKAGAFDNLQLNRASLVASIDRAFEFANATTEANANQGGLFDMGGDDDHGSSTQEPDLVEAMPWGVKERLTLEKTAIGFYLSGHLFDEVSQEVRRFVKRQIDDLIDSREPQLLAGIVSDFRVINGQRGKLALFKLDDKSAVIDARADEALINANRNLLKEDELIIVMGKLQPDRFSGGLQLTVNQVWDLATARCRFGKYLKAWPSMARPRTSSGSWCATFRHGAKMTGTGRTGARAAALTRHGPPRRDYRSAEHPCAPAAGQRAPVSRSLGGRPDQRRGQSQRSGFAGGAQQPAVDAGQTAPSTAGYGRACTTGVQRQAAEHRPTPAPDADL